MPDALLTIVIPTLAADEKLDACVRSLDLQSRREFDVVVVDNSGESKARRRLAAHRETPGLQILENSINTGFGHAINQGIQMSRTPLVATLNDDAFADPEWVGALLTAAAEHPEAGMFACQVRLAPDDDRSGQTIDSAGMLLAADGSSKQRGHGRPAREFSEPAEVLFPSGSAAMYRRAMLRETGGFDESFFLYCEDTDLGLRGRWAGWSCAYVPEAIVYHHYSHSAGRASAVKAYFVERNRLFTVIKSFPARMLAAAPFSSLLRYTWHGLLLVPGHGKASQYRESGGGLLSLLWILVRAHGATLKRLPHLMRQRASIRRHARISGSDFVRLARAHAITARQVAAL